jgi:Domain of unknown function (DUF4189)/TIR domain/Putative peptidoglycan binding domain
MSGKIFINYRRGDEPGFTQALLGRLEQAFPADRLFIDIDSILPGEDFIHKLESQVAQCDAMLTVIGVGWLNATDERGNRRLDDPSDFVRIEIASALKQGKRVIPVLVHDARMPRPEELPEGIRPLASRNAVRLTHERFRADVQGLIKSLRGTIAEVAAPVSGAGMDYGLSPARRSRVLVRSLITLCVLGILGLGSAGIWLENSRVTSPPRQSVAVQPAQSQAAPAQSTTAAPQTPATPVQPPSTDSSSPQIATPPASAAKPDAASVETAFWNSIKDEKNPRLFEAYLSRYPNGAFADLARIAIDNLKAAALTPPAQQTDGSALVTDAASLNELRERLYELNFDLGPVDGPLTNAAHQAIREFQQQINLPPTGVATIGVLGRLRELGGLKPWGAIAFGKSNGKWGMAWDEATRKAAVASARASCGDAAGCSVEISFFGTSCGVFAYSASAWAITARDDIAKAKEAALADCAKRGKACQIVASVCADGTQRSGVR